MTYLPGVRLPEEIERGMIGGPQFDTTVLPLDSGFEKRNANWQDTIEEYDLGYGMLQKFQDDPEGLELDLDTLLNFFYIVNGKAFSWRLKDWIDYEIGRRNGSDAEPQLLLLGDGVTDEAQAFKRYSYAGHTHDRRLTKLVDGTVELFLDGSPLTITTHYAVNHDTGLITLVTPPAATGGSGPDDEQVVTYRTDFDVHARLDVDALKLNLEMFNAGQWPNIPVVGVRGTGLE